MPHFDRTDFTQPHVGPRILPNTPFFSQLLRHAHTLTSPCIRDLNLSGLSKTHADLLSDALHLREYLRQRLPQALLDRLLSDKEEITIGVLAPGGYEYVVAVLAVLALGAAVVPMTVTLPTQEAVYFVRKSAQIAIVTSVGASDLGAAIVHTVNNSNDGPPFDAHYPVQTIPVLPNLPRKRRIPSHMVISQDRYLDDNKAGVVIFTSGTTGPPKGAVLRRGYLHEAARSVAAHYVLTPKDTLLHLLPVHHVTGLAINILPFLMAGSCIEFRSGPFDAKWTWERWRNGVIGEAPRLTIFSGVPTVYQRMWRYWESRIESLPETERKGFEDGAKQMRLMICGTSALPRPVARFWERIRGGKGILTRYGSTEVGAVLRVPLEEKEVPDGSVGVVAPGVELKLVDGETGREGDEGEIWVKTPELFSKYLGEEVATCKSFSEDGWFKTGDVARRRDQWYWIVGRSSQDIIKSGGYKISALDVEREILALGYVGEVIVVKVPDEEFGERVGAVLTLREGQDVRKLSLERLRRDLRDSMASYKMPTLLTVMTEELPKTASGKVLKKVLGPQLFPSPLPPEVQVWRPNASRL